MASEDEELAEIDEEIARIEQEIQRLEQETDAEEPLDPGTPDPEPAEADVPDPEAVFEGEADVDAERTLLSRLKDRVGTLRRKRAQAAEDADAEAGEDEMADPTALASPTEDASQAPPTPAEAPEPDSDAEDTEEEADGGRLAGMVGSLRDRFPGGAEDEPAEPAEEPAEEEPAEADVPDPEAEAESEPPEAPEGPEDREPPPQARLEAEESPEPEPATTTTEADRADGEPEPEAEPEPEDEDEGSGAIAGLIGSVGRRIPQIDRDGGSGTTLAADPAGVQRLRRPPAGAGHAYEASEPSGPLALLERFRSKGEAERAAAEPEEEEESNRGIIVAALVGLVVLIAAGVGAYYLVGTGGGGEPLSANLVADSFTSEDGSYVAITGQAITLDASASEGSPEEYRWDFGDGSEETTTDPTVQHTFEQRGSYTVQLALVNGNEEATTEVAVLAVDPPQAQPRVLLDGEPVSQAGTVGNNAFLDDELTLDGSASTADPDLSLTAHEWDIDGDGEPDETGETVETVFDEPGGWAVELIVRDDLGNEGSATSLFHVSDRRTFQGTVGPSTDQADTNDHDLPVEEGRMDVPPLELRLALTYGGGDDVVQSEADLDLQISDPDGTTFQAQDDDGQGEETLTVAEDDLGVLGNWTVTVSQDQATAGSLSETDYEVVVETIY